MILDTGGHLSTSGSFLITLQSPCSSQGTTRIVARHQSWTPVGSVLSTLHAERCHLPVLRLFLLMSFSCLMVGMVSVHH